MCWCIIVTEIELFGKLCLHYTLLDGEIDAKTDSDFKQQFEKLFSSDSARGSKRVVYIWSTRSCIPRLKGKSNIVYIGKTRSSLYERHHRYAKVEGEGLNWERYRHIIEEFGPIVVHCAACDDDPRETEKALIHLYLTEHLELPPLNQVR